jgi:hypothetical protein
MTRCRCASDASGPIRVTSSVGSPTVYSAAAATAGSTTSSRFAAGTSIRVHAPQTWPPSLQALAT